MGRSVLDLGVFNGNLELVQKLLAAHCTAEHRDRDGNSPMHFAVSGAGGQNKLLLECLDAARCSVSKANAIRETALHLAARLDRGGATEWLLGKGATVGATDQFLNTPLHIAASFNILSAIEILINSGGNVNQAAVDGRTPLHCASQAGAAFNRFSIDSVEQGSRLQKHVRGPKLTWPSMVPGMRELSGRNEEERNNRN
ncbi:ankyrin repeat protein [Ilyonectria robusta]